MYIVIAGGGKIGRYIAKDLESKRHEVTVIERHPGRCEQLVAETNVLVIEGDAGDVRYLEQAHVDRADVFVATTHDDDDNLVSCQLAKIEFGLKRAIARVNTPKNVEIFEKLGIEAVSSTRLISELIENEFSVGELIHLHSLKGGRVSLVEVRIPDEDDDHAPSPRRVSTLDLPTESVIVALFRGDLTVIPRGDTEIHPGDEVVALTTPDLEDALRAILVGES
ncbi:MAG: NAD-binding protein [Actinobacteria bacterium]|nr:NAD-binding protein [Actinomycetota bacterium]